MHRCGRGATVRRMRSSTSLAAALLLVALLDTVAVPAAIRPVSARRTAEGRAASRARLDGDVLPSVGECDTTRGTHAYGSPERCRRALCSGRNVVNAFVTDASHRLRRNPCAGVDPFERP